MSGSFHIGRGCGPEQVLQVGRRRQHRGPLLAGYWAQSGRLTHLLHIGDMADVGLTIDVSNAGYIQERLVVQHVRGSAFSPPWPRRPKAD